ncbi:MAG: hypothetical protein ACYS32_04375 [Planctomycetota bacterium]|jgi:hypothetical protein
MPHIIPASQVLPKNPTAGFGQGFPERADTNVKAQMGRTPLHWMAIISRKDMVEVLIANGANVNVKDGRVLHVGFDSGEGHTQG